jgi:hypothetical protein
MWNTVHISSQFILYLPDLKKKKKKNISVNSLSLDSDVELLSWECGGKTFPWFFMFKFLHCDSHICSSKFHFTSLDKQRTYYSKMANNSAIKVIFEWVRNNWNPYLSPQWGCMGGKFWFLGRWSGSLTLVKGHSGRKLGIIGFGCGEGKGVGWWKEGKEM